MKDIEIEIAIKEGRIILTTAQQTRQGIVGFNVYWHRNAINSITPITEGPHWNDKKGCHYCNAYGTDRRLEIVLALGREYGLEFKDISQKYKWL